MIIPLLGPGTAVPYALQDTVPFGFLRIVLAIRFPVAWVGLNPLSLAQLLVEPVVRIRLNLVSLPGRFLGPLTFLFLAGGLVLVPRTRIKKITTINTEALLHIHLLLIRENGIRERN